MIDLRTIAPLDLELVEESVRRTRLVYEQHDAADRLVHDIFAGGHQWHGTEALPFFDRWLGHEGSGRLD